MSSCNACGHQLGAGRFCTNCGAPVDSSTPDGTPISSTPAPPPMGAEWAVDTAERAVPVPAESPLPTRAVPTSPPASATSQARPRTPPSAVAPPPPPRYPLYADEVDGWTPYGPVVPTRPAPLTPAEPVEAQPAPISAGDWTSAEPEHDEPAYADSEDWSEEWVEDERRSPLLWVLAAVVVLGVVVAGWFYLARDTGTTETARDGAGGASAAAKPTDVAGDASAKAPKTAPPNDDVNQQRVSYDASNMLDGDPETTWRMTGSGAGTTLTFTLAEPTEISSVGMINGYAKTATDSKGRRFDWYAGNRRVKAVVWTVGDTKVRQQLETDDRQLQSIDVDPTTTDTVTVKLVRVTDPGSGTAARNYTAISEISLVGVPAS